MSTGTARALWLIAILVLAAACVALSRQLGTERDRTQLEMERIVRLQTRLDSLQRSRIETSPSSERASTSTVSSNAPTPALPTSTVTTAQAPPRLDPDAELARRQKAMQKASAQMLEDPESRKLALTEMKTNLRHELPNVGRLLRLSVEEEDQLFDLLADQRMRGWERGMKARAAGQSPTFSLEEFEAGQRAEEAEIAALLGSQRSRQFKEYQESLPERERVASFVATLDENDALGTESAEKLIARLADQRKALEERARTEHAGQSSKMTMGFASGVSLTLSSDEPADLDAEASSQMEAYDQKMAEVAAPLLTTRQLKAFTDFQARQREVQLAHLRDMLVSMQQRKKPQPAKPAQ